MRKLYERTCWFEASDRQGSESMDDPIERVSYATPSFLVLPLLLLVSVHVCRCLRPCVSISLWMRIFIFPRGVSSLSDPCLRISICFPSLQRSLLLLHLLLVAHALDTPDGLFVAIAETALQQEKLGAVNAQLLKNLTEHSCMSEKQKESERRKQPREQTSSDRIRPPSCCDRMRDRGQTSKRASLLLSSQIQISPCCDEAFQAQRSPGLAPICSTTKNDRETVRGKIRAVVTTPMAVPRALCCRSYLASAAEVDVLRDGLHFRIQRVPPQRFHQRLLCSRTRWGLGIRRWYGDLAHSYPLLPQRDKELTYVAAASRGSVL